jgi:hypothetical protein
LILLYKRRRGGVKNDFCESYGKYSCVLVLFFLVQSMVETYCRNVRYHTPQNISRTLDFFHLIRYALTMDKRITIYSAGHADGYLDSELYAESHYVASRRKKNMENDEWGEYTPPQSPPPKYLG